RRYRRSGRADELAVGAWLELLDGLDQAGMVAEPGWTSSDVGREAGRYFGSDLEPSVSAVGALADRAVFSTTQLLDRPEAERAWEMQRHTTRAIRRRLDRRQRLRATLVV